MAFFQAVAHTVGFIHGSRCKKVSCGDELHDCVMSESTVIREGASQFVCKFVTIQDMLQRRV